MQILSAPPASVEVIPIPSDTPPIVPTSVQDTVHSPPPTHTTAQSPSAVILTPHLPLTDIDPDHLSSFTVTTGANGQPELHTQGDPHTAARVFTLLMNQLVSPGRDPPPSPHSLPAPDTNPLTPVSNNETPPSRKRGFKMDSLRRSVRIRAQGAEDIPVLAKAQGIVQRRYNLRSGSKGNALLQNHPYARLTVKEISSLFRAYQIQLGVNDTHASTIIQAIKMLDRSDFDRMIHQALDALKAQSDNFCLVLDLDASGQLSFQ